MEKYNLVPRAKRAIELAVDIATKAKHQRVNCAHLLCAIVDSGSIHIIEAMEHFSISVENLKKALLIELKNLNPDYFNKQKGESNWTPDSDLVFETALVISEDFNQHFIGVEHLLIGILKESNVVKDFLVSKGVPLEDLLDSLLCILSPSEEDEKKMRTKHSQENSDGKQEKYLEKYCYNLNETVLKLTSKIQGRDSEIEKLIEILSCKIKNNAVLVGDAGVGKTAIIEGLAQKINSLECPVFFSKYKILSLDVGLMVAGTKYRGQFEERFKGLIDELKKDDQAILFIDEIHSIVGTGSTEGTLDLANMIKPALARGEIKCIGATTHAEYKKFFEKDAALNRRFQLLTIDEPSKKQTFDILKKAKEGYENFHGVTYNDNIITNIIDLSDKYLPYRKFPDKAFDILDRIGANGKIEKFKIPSQLKDQEQKIFTFIDKVDMDKEENKVKCQKLLSKFLNKRNDWLQKTSDTILEINENHVIDIISKISGLNKCKIELEGNSSILSLKEEIESKIFDQTEVVEKIYNTLLCAKAGIKKTKKTLANFLFVGSTGVGKTYTAKIIAEKFYNKSNSFLQIDMAEYVDKNSISKLIGATAGYVGYEEGGLLSEFVRNNPNSLILFDEVDKAHPDIVNILLKIMDEGVIIDNFNRKIDFSNTIIVLTGNIGAEFETSRSMGFIDSKTSEIRSTEYSSAVKKQFKPELIARLDEVLIFNSKFSKEAIYKMISRNLLEIQENLLEKNILLEPSDEIKDYLYSLIIKENNNARSIEKILRLNFELPLCKLIAANQNISEIHTKVIDNSIVFL